MKKRSGNAPKRELKQSMMAEQANKGKSRRGRKSKDEPGVEPEFAQKQHGKKKSKTKKVNVPEF